MDPANAVIRSAIRSWTSFASRASWAATTGWCGRRMSGWLVVMMIPLLPSRVRTHAPRLVPTTAAPVLHVALQPEGRDGDVPHEPGADLDRLVLLELVLADQAGEVRRVDPAGHVVAGRDGAEG